ncbi:NADase-type glycan-binding domain-containing protein [Nocardioides pakistanensis]
MKRSREDEYAEAFRLGYERARRGHEPTVAVDRDELTPLDDLLEPGRDAPVKRPVRRPPTRLIGLVALAVVLVASAFLVGRLLAGSDGPAGDATVAAVEGRADTAGAAGPEPYGGAVAAVQVEGSEATCRSGASVDAAGNPVTYEPARAHDADLSTAWRCDGSGVGQRLILLLPEGAGVAEVGLVPGYAKTDPVSGVDRYAENNRITRVRWHFADGSSVVQRIDGDPADRSMRTMRVPVAEGGRVVLEILEAAPGRRDTIAISEVRVAGPSA